MKILFIHQNFPAQFVHWAAHLARDPSHTVVALAHHETPLPPGIRRYRYTLPRQGQHALDQQIVYAQACAQIALRLRDEGFTPDAIVVHAGWGEGLLLKDIFPGARLIVYGEFYYDADGPDAAFDPAGPPVDFGRRASLRLRNTLSLQQMDVADLALAPTQWQRSLFPAWVQQKMQVLHDGIDYARLQPQPGLSLSLGPNRPLLRRGDEVLSFIARNLEPVRGFHVFMRLLPALLARRPALKVVIVGGDGNSYSYSAPGGKSWRAHMLDEVGSSLDPQRVFFTGTLPYQSYAALAEVSKVRAYWTTPFVLSWSLLEAAAGGVRVIASDTQPVREFAGDFDLPLCPFFDQSAWLAALEQALEAPLAPRQPRHVERIDSGFVSRRLEQLLGD